MALFYSFNVSFFSPFFRFWRPQRRPQRLNLCSRSVKKFKVLICWLAVSFILLVLPKYIFGHLFSSGVARWPHPRWTHNGFIFHTSKHILKQSAYHKIHPNMSVSQFWRIIAPSGSLQRPHPWVRFRPHRLHHLHRVPSTLTPYHINSRILPWKASSTRIWMTTLQRAIRRHSAAWPGGLSIHSQMPGFVC